MNATVVTVTNRLGGLDVLRASLDRQTRKPDAVVLVDYWYDVRARLVADRLPEVAHLPPRKGYAPQRFDPCQAWNTGFAAAPNAHVFLIASDYWLWGPSYVEEHAAAFATSRGIGALCGDHDVHALLPVRVAGSAEDLAWSVFVDPIVGTAPTTPLKAPCRKPRLSSAPWPGYSNVACDQYHGGPNESAPAWAIRAVNGFDEAYDGARYYPDTDLAVRLTRVGVVFCGKTDEPGAVNTRFDPHDLPAWLPRRGGTGHDFDGTYLDAAQHAERRAWLEAAIHGARPARADNGGFKIA